MSLTFIRFVLFISAIVINYREGYIAEDKTVYRFILLVILFVLSIMLLVLNLNVISILLGWDGLGLTSYALVIYYQNSKSFNAGILTALSNRLGDAALLMAIAWGIRLGGWNLFLYFDFCQDKSFIGFILFFIILASLTKRAQIPFSSWLPAAIAAPTPVSSLVHSSTLVTAGVYLLIRFNAAFSPGMINFLLFISLITIFIAGIGACMEFDLKKIIALSTLSQLGLIITVLALGRPDLAFFHLLIHAFFKALLFICAGIVIHSLMGCQDIRYIGSLVDFMPLTCLLFNICNLALCGLPFLSGFYSKDLIAEAISIEYLSLFVYTIFYFSIGLTACYRFRLTYYSMVKSIRSPPLCALREENKPILKRILRLAFLVIIMGSLLGWILFPTPSFICLPLFMKLITLIIVVIGAWFGYRGAKFNINYELFSFKFIRISTFIARIWNIPTLATLGLRSLLLRLGKLLLNRFDQGWLEYYGPQKLRILFKKFSQWLQLLSENYFKVYLLFLLLWIGFLLILILIS